MTQFERVMHTTDALILKKEPLGEADLLVTALTSRFVKMRFVAQGARKVEAKLKGHLEPICFSRLFFVFGRNGYRLVGAELLNFFGTVKSDPARMKIAAEIVSMCDKSLFEDASGHNSGFFELVLGALSVVDNAEFSAAECEREFIRFNGGFLKELGLSPEKLLY